MLPLRIDRSAATPLNDQIVDQLQELISRRALIAGSRLPSSRLLAQRLGVSRNTVVLAYERLLSMGWIESGVGRGTFVSQEPPVAESGASNLAEAPAFVWEPSIARQCPRPVNTGPLRDPGLENGSIRLDGAVPDPATYPTERIRRIFQQVLRREGSQSLGYGSAAGYRPLREIIAARASAQGVPTRADDVLIVGGSQQGLDLLARLLLGPGDGVVVSSPSYANALQIWRLQGARVFGVPMDEKGVLPDHLAAVLARERPKFVYLMPTFHNPTGLTMDQARRRAVMAVVEEAGVPVVEDHFDSELRYGGLPELPLRALDCRGQVVLVDTFSKILCPGFRIGWIIAPPPVRQRLLDLKRICDLATSLPAQMAVAEFCRRGELDRHLERVRQEYGHRLETMLRAIDRHFPPTVTVTRPQGGITVWVSLPAGSDGRAICRTAAERGVLVAPGEWFFADGGGGEHLRLSYIGESPERIERGIEVLGRVLSQGLESRSGTRLEETAPFV